MRMDIKCTYKNRYASVHAIQCLVSININGVAVGGMPCRVLEQTVVSQNVSPSRDDEGY